MDQSSHIRAMFEEWEDDLPRLAFADWLEKNGQASRAAWIRASCRLARTHSDDPALGGLAQLVRDLFEECRPSWWQRTQGLLQWNRRGLFRFEIKSKAASARFGKLDWLDQAVTSGWLEGVAFKCDGYQRQQMMNWKEPAQQVPIFLEALAQISVDGLAFYLEHPSLWGLKLSGMAIENPSVARLGRCCALRELDLEGLPIEKDISNLSKQIAKLPMLRRLRIDRVEVTKRHLQSLAELPQLRDLCFYNCRGLTRTNLASLCRSPKLRWLRLWGGDSPAEADLADLRTSLARVEVERV